MKYGVCSPDASGLPGVVSGPPLCKGGHIVALTVKGGQTVTLILSTTIKTSVTDHQVTESRVIRRA